MPQKFNLIDLNLIYFNYLIDAQFFVLFLCILLLLFINYC